MSDKSFCPFCGYGEVFGVEQPPAVRRDGRLPLLKPAENATCVNGHVWPTSAGVGLNNASRLVDLWDRAHSLPRSTTPVDPMFDAAQALVEACEAFTVPFDDTRFAGIDRVRFLAMIRLTANLKTAIKAAPARENRCYEGIDRTLVPIDKPSSGSATVVYVAVGPNGAAETVNTLETAKHIARDRVERAVKDHIAEVERIRDFLRVEANEDFGTSGYTTSETVIRALRRLIAIRKAIGL